MIQHFSEKREPMPTAAGAIVMALGIFVNGAAYRLPAHEAWGPIFTLGLFAVWAIIASSFVTTAWQKRLKSTHMSDPIQSFAVGTWIAGTAVCGTAIAKRLPDAIGLSYGLATIALALWLYYIVIAIRNFRIIWASGLYRSVHGVILLSAVSTQSLVILFQTLLGDFLPGWIFASVIVLGAGFYFFGFFLIIKRYAAARTWNIADEWPNTNCILHGAMSITGLACAATGAVSPAITFGVWLWVLFWFVIVEGVECARAWIRIRRYGLSGGIGIYHVSQWSRNFTFGMLYAFTYFFDLRDPPLEAGSVFHYVQQTILDFGAWIVLAFLVNECLLFVKDKTGLSR